ncbi:hypothetical protein F8388_004324 [Cannabis sativa]|uniref:RNase H type-1 domain-containing protein n=1 Tax=Cannabis sativa TaxID=3483 RepID=A0A7J6HA99_CANSA|nr:hypothetical protein F8388_004324 [Cannabis sativa]
MCGQEGCDDASHFVSSCPVTKSLWFSSRWGIKLDSIQFSSGREVVSWLLQPPFRHLLSNVEASSFFLYDAILYHKLWLCHNEIFHRGTLMDVDMVRKRVEDCFLEHNRLLVEEKGNGEGLRGVAEVRWVLPRPGRVRGFVDFALADGVGAVAAVFFDNLSSVKVFGAKKVNVQSVFHGEMEALRFGVDLALKCSLEGLISFQMMFSLSMHWWLGTLHSRIYISCFLNSVFLS